MKVVRHEEQWFGRKPKESTIQTQPKCEKYNCFGLDSYNGNSCNDKGSCTSPDTCDRINGYHGHNCTEFTCFGMDHQSEHVCLGHGKCVDLDVCNCHENFYGDDCQTTTCYGTFSSVKEVCNGHGLCIATNQCVCEKNYNGTNCDITECFGISNQDDNACSGNGKCIDYNQCQCRGNGVFGDNCEHIPAIEDIISFSKTATTINLSWMESPVLGVIYLFGVEHNTTNSFTTPYNTFIFTGLTPNTTYQLTIRVHKNGAQSPTMSLTTTTP